MFFLSTVLCDCVKTGTYLAGDFRWRGGGKLARRHLRVLANAIDAYNRCNGVHSSASTVVLSNSASVFSVCRRRMEWIIIFSFARLQQTNPGTGGSPATRANTLRELAGYGPRAVVITSSHSEPRRRIVTLKRLLIRTKQRTQTTAPQGTLSPPQLGLHLTQSLP